MEDIRDNGRILSESAQHVTEEAIKGEIFPANSIIVSTSATIGEHALACIPFLANQRFTCLMVKNYFQSIVDMKYLLFYHCFKLGEYCKRHLNQGNFASVDMGKFNEFVFDIPSLKRQQQIVSILDKFDSYCNDITQGLPAEIEMRKKQYEYYRDRLLSFQADSVK